MAGFWAFVFLRLGGCATRDAGSARSPNGIHPLPHGLSSTTVEALSNAAGNVPEGVVVCRVLIADIRMRSHCHKKTDRACRYVSVVQWNQHPGRCYLHSTTGGKNQRSTVWEWDRKNGLYAAASSALADCGSSRVWKPPGSTLRDAYFQRQSHENQSSMDASAGKMVPLKTLVIPSQHHAHYQECSRIRARERHSNPNLYSERMATRLQYCKQIR